MLNSLKKILFVFLFLSFIVSLVNGCNKRRENQELKNKIKQLQEDLTAINKDKKKSEEKLSKAKKKIKKLEQKLGKGTDDLIYMNLKFPTNGNFYKENKEEKCYYSDPTCTKKIDNPRFLSYRGDPETAENGLAIECFRLDNGSVCYTPRTQTSYLITEEKWQEEKKIEERKRKESEQEK